jgi:hypothetical protein
METQNWDLPDQNLDREDYCGNPVSTCYLQVPLSVLGVENWPVLYEYSSPRVGNQAHLSHSPTTTLLCNIQNMAPQFVASLQTVSRRMTEVVKPTNPDALILEAWAQGYMVGSIIIMICITLSNTRRGVLLHKLILLEVYI